MAACRLASAWKNERNKQNEKENHSKALHQKLVPTACRHAQKTVVYSHLPDSPLPVPLLGLEHILVVGVPFLVLGRRPLVVGRLLVAVPTVLAAVPLVLADERLPLEQLR